MWFETSRKGNMKLDMAASANILTLDATKNDRVSEGLILLTFERVAGPIPVTSELVVTYLNFLLRFRTVFVVTC
jgi:hypothetical protein